MLLNRLKLRFEDSLEGAPRDENLCFAECIGSNIVGVEYVGNALFGEIEIVVGMDIVNIIPGFVEVLNERNLIVLLHHILEQQLRQRFLIAFGK